MLWRLGCWAERGFDVDQPNAGSGSCAMRRTDRGVEAKRPPRGGGSGAAKSCRDLVDEMFRILYLVVISVNGANPKRLVKNKMPCPVVPIICPETCSPFRSKLTPSLSKAS